MGLGTRVQFPPPPLLCCNWLYCKDLRTHGTRVSKPAAIEYLNPATFIINISPITI
jgi:hypothetical protein